MAASRSALTDPVQSSVVAAMFSDNVSAPVHKADFKVMGTTARITLVGGPPETPERIKGLLEQLERRWSRFRDDSEISLLNNSPQHAGEVSEETKTLFRHMQRGFHLTRGAFDPTILPALVAEGYGESLVNPGARTLVPGGSLRRGDFAGITLEGGRLHLPAGTTLDSGGVGKGLAADMGSELAVNSGALGALVDVGGDVRVCGVSPRADHWRLAIEHPEDPAQRLSIVEITNQGIATSTVTKRRFRVGDRSTHHLIDPRTGQSAESDTVQATVIAGSAAEAEMWTKVAFVHGSETLLRQARREPIEVGCFLRDGRWVTSPGWPESHA